jgi:hypothetical protein
MKHHPFAAAGRDGVAGPPALLLGSDAALQQWGEYTSATGLSSSKTCALHKTLFNM